LLAAKKHFTRESIRAKPEKGPEGLRYIKERTKFAVHRRTQKMCWLSKNRHCIAVAATVQISARSLLRSSNNFAI
jgi:hypothetical protein